MAKASETFRVRVAGDLACFTRPEFKVERVSYEVMTPSAARAVLEAVHWKPAIRWVVTGIRVLNPVRFLSFKRNEVAGRVSNRDAAAGQRGESFGAYLTDEARQQRNTVALQEVDYVVEAHFVPAARWGPEDTMTKHAEMFRRRLDGGQTFHQPYLGCREFAARVGPAVGGEVSKLEPAWRPRELGLMLHDLEFGAAIVPRFFRARIDETGFIAVPPFETALVADGLTRGVTA